MQTITVTINSAKNSPPIELGHQGENLAITIQFDVTAWAKEYGDGSVVLLNQRKNETPYPVVAEKEDNIVTWNVTNVDTGIAGTGWCELQYYVGEVLAKSDKWRTITKEALGESGDVPEPWEGFLDEVSSLTARSETAATNAAQSAEAAAASESTVEGYKEEAETAAQNAAASQALSDQYAAAAALARQAAETSATAAQNSASAAAQSAAQANAAATNATSSATLAESWAVGGTDTRTGEDTDNAQYYATQAGDANDEVQQAKTEIQDSIDGVAQENTAQQTLALLTQIAATLDGMGLVVYVAELPQIGVANVTYITPDGIFRYEDDEFVQIGGSSGDLNGFSLSLGDNGVVVLSYTDPDDETITGSTTLPADNTAQSILDSITSIADSVALIAQGGN